MAGDLEDDRFVYAINDELHDFHTYGQLIIVVTDLFYAALSRNSLQNTKR